MKKILIILLLTSSINFGYTVEGMIKVLDQNGSCIVLNVSLYLETDLIPRLSRMLP